MISLAGMNDSVSGALVEVHYDLLKVKSVITKNLPNC